MASAPTDAPENDAPDYDNPEAAERLRDELSRREQEQTEQIASSLTVKERLEQKRDESTVEHEFMDETLEFRRPGADLQKRGIVLSKEFGGEDEEEIDAETTAELVDYMTGVLADLSINDELDEEFWGSFAFSDLEGVFEDVIATGSDGDVTEEEIEQFRGE